MKHNNILRSVIAFLLIGSIAFFSSCGDTSKKNEQGSASVEGITVPTKKDDQKVREFLTNFYNTYKNEGYDDAPRQSMMSSALRAAITHIREYESQNGDLVLDFDPFIDAQDIVGGLYSGEFNIDKLNDDDCSWQISYETGIETVRVALQVVEENGEYKINDVMIGQGNNATSLLSMSSSL